MDTDSKMEQLKQRLEKATAERDDALQEHIEIMKGTKKPEQSQPHEEPKPKNKGGRPRIIPEPLRIMNKIFEKPCLILTVGKSEQGKSYLVRYLLDYALISRVFKFGIVFQGSKGMNDDYGFLPDKAVKNGFDEAVLIKWIDKLKAQKERLVKAGKGADMPRSFIIFDDLLGILQKSAYMDNFFSLYRHLGITVFLNTQYLNTAASSTLVRQQTSFGFFFRSSAARTKDSLYEWFAGDISKDEFLEKYKRFTKEDYNCMLYISSERDPTKAFYRFQAPSNHKPTKVNY